MIGESRCPYTINPSFRKPVAKYLELNAKRLNLSLPSVPFNRCVGRDNHPGRSVAGAGPYAVGRRVILLESRDLSSSAGVASGGATPMMEDMEAVI